MRRKFLIALIFFIIGLAGDIIASALYDGIWKKGFDLVDFLILFVFVLIGLFFTSRLEKLDENNSDNSSNTQMSNIGQISSKIKTRGRKINLKNIFSINSEIDIDTKK